MKKNLLLPFLALSMALSLNLNNLTCYGNQVIPSVEAKYNAYINTSINQMNNGNLEGAKINLDKALEVRDTSYQALKLRGEVKNKLKDYKGAIEDLNKAIYIYADYDMYYLRGISKLAQENIESAIEDFSEAIKINPIDSYSYYTRGYASYLLGKINNDSKKFEDALYDFNKAISLNSKIIDAYLYRGITKAELYGSKMGLDDIKYAQDEYQKISDTKNASRCQEIYNWIKKDY